MSRVNNSSICRPSPPYELEPMEFEKVFHKLFVYGNLKRFGPLYYLIEDQTFISEAVTRDTYLLYDIGPFPALVENFRDGIAIHGELFEVDTRTLNILDQVEGKLYKRSEVHLKYPDYSYTTKIWGYIYQQKVSDSQKCGDTWPPIIEEEIPDGNMS